MAGAGGVLIKTKIAHYCTESRHRYPRYSCGVLLIEECNGLLVDGHKGSNVVPGVKILDELMGQCKDGITISGNTYIKIFT